MNKEIIGSALVIAGVGVTNAMLGHKPITKILVGGFLFLFSLSLLDIFGGPFSALAGMLAMLATLVTVLTVIPWSTILRAVGM